MQNHRRESTGRLRFRASHTRIAVGVSHRRPDWRPPVKDRDEDSEDVTAQPQKKRR